MRDIQVFISICAWSETQCLGVRCSYFSPW